MRGFHAVVLLVCGFPAALQAGREFTQQPGEQVVPNQVLIRMRPGVAANLVTAFLPNAVVSSLRLPDTYVVRLPPGIAASAIRQLAAHLLVDFVEPDRIRRSSLAAPNDPNYTNTSTTQWGLFTVQGVQACESLG